MCGISGMCNPPDNWEEQIHIMNSRMINRGPDNEGVWCSDNHEIALGHRRLAIIDVSDDGNQPFVSSSGRYVMVFNGEIYNHREIKDKLIKEKSDLVLKSKSDTEILLESIEYYGIEKTLSMSKGMFAIAVYDRKEKSLFLVRDRMGEKPLYYGFIGNRFVFASDIGCFEKMDGFTGEVDSKVLRTYFTYGCIPAPYSVYKEIYKLEPGEYLTINAPFDRDKITKRKYWSLREAAINGKKNKFDGSFEEATDELERLLTDAVKDQMISDVPLGAFLSGGVDSTVVTSLLQKCFGSKKIKTYTIGMKGSSFDEIETACETAKRLGTDHTEMYIDEKDVLDCIPMMADIFSEPMGDSSQIPTYLVSKLTKQHVTVALSGDGGDELFCGYDYFAETIRKWNKIKKIPSIFTKADRLISERLLRKGYNDNKEQKLIYAGSKSVEDVYRYNRYFENGYNLMNDFEYYSSPYDLYEDHSLKSDLSNIVLMSQTFILPDDILAKVDRTAMQVSLETRIPLFDRDIVEFAWRIPDEYKYDGTEKKRILRALLKKNISTDHMSSKKKGFSIPIQEWLKKESLIKWAEDLMTEEDKGLEKYLNMDVVKQMWTNYKEKNIWSQQIWYVLMFKLWSKKRKILL